MRKAIVWLSTCLMFLSSSNCFAQSPATVSALIKKSKLVDTGRDVNATITPRLTTVSTFSHPKASDQDCKITALLMMKELRQHYKSIHRLRAVFYDPSNIRNYREVEISEADVSLVDSGRPVADVLSSIDISTRTYTPASASRNNARGPSGNGSSMSSKLNSAMPPITGNCEMTSFRSSEGDVTMDYPKGWATSFTEPGALIKFFNTKTNSNCSAALYKVTLPIELNLEALVTQHETEAKMKYGNYKRSIRRQQNISGLPGIMFEASAEYQPGAKVAERSIFLRNHNTVYTLTMYSANLPDAEMNRLFQNIYTSLRIR